MKENRYSQGAREIERRGIDIFPEIHTAKRNIHTLQGSKEIKKQRGKSSPPLTPRVKYIS